MIVCVPGVLGVVFYPVCERDLLSGSNAPVRMVALGHGLGFSFVATLAKTKTSFVGL